MWVCDGGVYENDFSLRLIFSLGFLPTHAYFGTIWQSVVVVGYLRECVIRRLPACTGWYFSVVTGTILISVAQQQLPSRLMTGTKFD